MSKRPIAPVKPSSIELVFFYNCPYCNRGLPVVSPIQPTMISCDTCQQRFPIVPVDEYTTSFIKLMMANGPAAIDSDFL